MTDRGVWSLRPPGIENELISENSSYSGSSRSSKSKLPYSTSGSGSNQGQSHKDGDTRSATEEISQSKNQRNKDRRSYSRSPRSRARRSRSSSSSKGRSFRKNRRRYGSSSSSDRRGSSRSPSREKSRYRKQYRNSPAKTSRHGREQYKRRSRGRSGSASSSKSNSSDGGRSYRTNSHRRDGNGYKKHSKSGYNQPHYTSKKEYSGPSRHSYTAKELVPHQSEPSVAAVPFKNDGSFLEMFKKMQEAQKSAEGTSAQTEATAADGKKPVMPLVGKRRGGRVLKTGMVKKPKTIEEQTVDGNPVDAWSLYLQEVKKYKETSCEEEGKTRPLVK